MSFRDLQKDVIIEIFKKLRPRDVLKVSQTDKRTVKICNEKQTWLILMKTHYPKINIDYTNIKRQYINLTVGLLGMVLKYPDRDWDYGNLSQNPIITMEDVIAHPQIPWHYDRLSLNPSIMMKDVIAHPEIEWDIQSLSRNPSITIHDVMANPKLASFIIFISIAFIIFVLECDWIILFNFRMLNNITHCY